MAFEQIISMLMKALMIKELAMITIKKALLDWVIML